MDENIDNDIVESIQLLLHAVQHHPSCQDELFRVLTHLSPQLKEFLPVDQEEISQVHHTSQPVVGDFTRGNLQVKDHHVLNSIRSLTKILASYYTTKIKGALSDMISNATEILLAEKSDETLTNSCKLLTECLQKVQFLIGDKQAEEKLRSIVSRHMDSVLQLHLTYHTNSSPDFVQVKKEFTLVAKHTQHLVNTLAYVLACSGVYKEKCQLLEFIQDTVLEKLTIELLTLVDTLKNSTKKQNSKSLFVTNTREQQVGEFSAAVTNGIILPIDSLASFAGIANVYLTLEDYLKSCVLLQIVDYSSGRHKKGVLKHNPFDLPDLIQSSQHSSANRHKPAVKLYQWHWHEAIKDILYVLSSSVTHSIQETTSSLLDEAKHKYTTSYQLDITQSACSRIKDSTVDALCCITCVAEMLKLVLQLLPLGISGSCYKQLSKLQSDFLEAVNQGLKDIKPFLMTIIEDVPDKGVPCNLSIVLATAIDIVTVLKYCGDRMLHDGRLPFYETIQVYKTFSNHVQHLIKQYQKAAICTKLIHDAESHHWSDLRAFYEGERCSYAVEMWHYYMCDMISDLQSKLSFTVAGDIFVDVVYESVTAFANRYCNCLPSSNRSRQIWQDTMSILLSIYDWMWMFSSNAMEVCNIMTSQYEHMQNVKLLKIYTACKDLFMCGIILAAPTDQLHVVTKHRQRKLFLNFTTKWLSFMNPSVFPFDWDGMFSSLNDHTAIATMLKCMAGKTGNYVSLVRCILKMRRCHLSKQLVSGKILLSDTNVFFLQEQIIEVLTHDVSALPSVLMECVVSSPEYAYSMYFDLRFLDHDFSLNLLPWQKFLQRVLMPIVFNALLPVVGFVSSHTWSSVGRKIIDSLPSKMKSTIPNVHAGDLDHLKQIGVCMLLKTMQVLALSIPEPVMQFFLMVDAEIAEEDDSCRLQGGCYGSHFLMGAARAALLDIHHWYHTFDIDDNSLLASELTEVAAAIVNIDEFKKTLSEKYSVANTCVSEVVTEFKDAMRNVFDHSHLVNDFGSKVSESDDLVPDFGLNYTVQKQECLQKLHEVLSYHYDEIAEQWNITFAPSVFQDAVNSGKSAPHQSTMIDHHAIVSAEIDWNQLLQKCITAEPDATKVLVSHRADMQHNAHLNAEEKMLVPAIQRYFEMT